MAYNKANKVTPFEKKLWLASPTMHGEELKYMQEAYETNWMSTVGANINEVERITCEKIGCALESIASVPSAYRAVCAGAAYKCRYILRVPEEA